MKIPTTVTTDAFTVDLLRHRILYPNNIMLIFSETVFRMLVMLLNSSAISYQEFYDEFWQGAEDKNKLAVYMSELRRTFREKQVFVELKARDGKYFLRL